MTVSILATDDAVPRTKHSAMRKSSNDVRNSRNGSSRYCNSPVDSIDARREKTRVFPSESPPQALSNVHREYKGMPLAPWSPHDSLTADVEMKSVRQQRQQPKLSSLHKKSSSHHSKPEAEHSRSNHSGRSKDSSARYSNRSSDLERSRSQRSSSRSRRSNPTRRVGRSTSNEGGTGAVQTRRCGKDHEPQDEDEDLEWATEQWADDSELFPEYPFVSSVPVNTGAPAPVPRAPKLSRSISQRGSTNLTMVAPSLNRSGDSASPVFQISPNPLVEPNSSRGGGVNHRSRRASLQQDSRWKERVDSSDFENVTKSLRARPERRASCSYRSKIGDESWNTDDNEAGAPPTASRKGAPDTNSQRDSIRAFSRKLEHDAIVAQFQTRVKEKSKQSAFSGIEKVRSLHRSGSQISLSQHLLGTSDHDGAAIPVSRQPENTARQERSRKLSPSSSHGDGRPCRGVVISKTSRVEIPVHSVQMVSTTDSTTSTLPTTSISDMSETLTEHRSALLNGVPHIHMAPTGAVPIHILSTSELTGPPFSRPVESIRITDETMGLSSLERHKQSISKKTKEKTQRLNSKCMDLQCLTTEQSTPVDLLRPTPPIQSPCETPSSRTCRPRSRSQPRRSSSQSRPRRGRHRSISRTRRTDPRLPAPLSSKHTRKVDQSCRRRPQRTSKDV
uniref:Uncharacterized protein n=1 Tax=Phaeodactylum tricornutum TaxID=2850 RepID=A0A8J9T5X6_PHATR